MQEEIWKDVVGYECSYQVSNLGRIRSWKWKKTKKGSLCPQPKIIKPFLRDDGYEEVKLKLHNKRINVKVHQLVARAFIPNPNNYPCVNHKDENRSNNVVSNLEWCNHSYNVLYGNGRQKRKNTILQRYGGHYIRKKVYQYSKDGTFIAQYESILDAAAAVNTCPSNISESCDGKRKAKGFIWKKEQR